MLQVKLAILMQHIANINNITVTEDTTGVDLSFSTSESVSIDTVVNSDDEIHAIKVGADPFAMNITTLSSN